MADPLESLDVPGKAVNGATNCGAASLQVLPINRKRTGAILTNDGAAVIYLHFGGGAAVIGFGPRLIAAGGVYNMDSTNLRKEQISAIAMAANTNLSWVEFS